MVISNQEYYMWYLALANYVEAERAVKMAGTFEDDEAEVCFRSSFDLIRLLIKGAEQVGISPLDIICDLITEKDDTKGYSLVITYTQIDDVSKFNRNMLSTAYEVISGINTHLNQAGLVRHPSVNS